MRAEMASTSGKAKAVEAARTTSQITAAKQSTGAPLVDSMTTANKAGQATTTANAIASTRASAQ